MLNSVRSVWRKRWTSFWTKAYTYPSIVLTCISTLNHYVNSPDFKSYLGVLDVPKEITIALAVVGMIALLAEDH